MDLQQLSEYTDGWNGPRSLGANAESFRLAGRFAQLIQDNASLRISPTIFAIGTAALEITNGDCKLLIEFAPNGDLAVNVDTPVDQLDYDLVGFNGSAIPEELRRFL